MTTYVLRNGRYRAGIVPRDGDRIKRVGASGYHTKHIFRNVPITTYTRDDFLGLISDYIPAMKASLDDAGMGYLWSFMIDSDYVDITEPKWRSVIEGVPEHILPKPVKDIIFGDA